MKPRKTIDVKDIVEKANFFFKNSDNMFFSNRATLHGFVSGILHKTGNYKGFRYLTEKEVNKDYTFGVSYDKNNKATHHDETRIQFI